uniref:Protein MIS12 homolog n=1 Tax=Angiostrongylus cantonensis TaxID=6313 RepID=A0A0K0D528_ANGCA
MDDVEAELINELEFQYYGFSPFGFVDTVYNDCVQSWVEAVEEVFSSAPFSEMEDKQGYLAEVTKMFFHSKGIKEATDILTERILKYVLRIPRHVTLPEHEYTHQLLFSGEPDVQELNRQNSKLAKCIVEYRTTLKELKERIQEANDAAEVLTTLIEQLERASLDVTDDPVGDSDVNTPS